MIARTHNLVLRVSAEELTKLKSIAHANDEPMARTVRRWIDVNYRAAFGEKGMRR